MKNINSINIRHEKRLFANQRQCVKNKMWNINKVSIKLKRDFRRISISIINQIFTINMIKLYFDLNIWLAMVILWRYVSVNYLISNHDQR